VSLAQWQRRSDPGDISKPFKKEKMSVKLYVGNLPFSMTENDLTDLFAQAGNVARVQMINDRVTGRPRGFGFVEMGTAEEAQAAIAKFHGQEINGRALTVNEARPMEQREGGGGGGGYRGGGGGGGGDRRGGGGGGDRRGGDRGDRGRRY
jgi:RNA recognition motif-containing protein